jgi:hypothetical protein
MRSLREPISFAQGVYLLLAFAGIGLVLDLAGGPPIGLRQWVVLILLLGFVVQPLSTLIHELGHAAAVIGLARRRALVVVGRSPWAELKAGRLHVRFGPRPARGVLFRGLCVHDSEGLPWRTLGLIALAGPLATFLELALLLAAAPALWHAGALLRPLIVLTAGCLTGSLLSNLSGEPLRGSGGRIVVGQRDGWQARRAFALHRQGAPPPRRGGAAAS